MATASPGTCIIGRNIAVRGTISGEEDLIVEGRVEGSVSLAGHLTVAAEGVVQADLDVESVVVMGEVVGDITASTSVTIEPGARVTGNIRAPRVIIRDGAFFDGSVDMEFTVPDHLLKGRR
ncbi:MAG: polymer-forming cytoskeletal protein [Deltaproteobacteria bacterium]|nr:MAG: polymer-forming cytoskeletal protein [Deltaproteobacteria bacterium]